MSKPGIGYWGIDVGQCALKAIRLELQDGKPVATAYDHIEHPKILSQPDADPDALTREALEKFLGRNPLGKDHVAVSIAGQSGLARFVKLPPVEEKKIPEIVKFEAKQQIPFPLDEVVWDFQKIAGGDAVGGFAMETEVGLFAMKREVIARYLGQFTQVKAEVHLVQMAPLALCNFATYEILKKGGPDPVEADGAPLNEGEEDDTPRGKRRCAVVLDIGTDNSNLIITDGGKIIWQRPIPLGGNHFTRALTKEMKLTFAKAEHLKRNAAKSPELAQILRALRPVLTEFVGEVQRSLGYFTNTHRDAHVAYMVGLGNAFKLPGLQKYLSEKLSLEVRKPAQLNRITGDSVLSDPNFQENLLTFPVAIGLALQGLELARLNTTLLPPEIKVDRLIRAKKPWAAAAAACLLLGSGAVAMGYSAQLAAVTDPKIATAIGKSDSAVAAAKAQDGERAGKEGAVTATTAEVKAIITGNDERLNWVRLNEVLVNSLPQHGDPRKGPVPGNGNLLLPEQLPFWSDAAGGARAYDKYRERMGMGIPLEKIFDDDMSQYLAQVNLEAIYCRWCESPAAFLAKAEAASLKDYGLRIADYLKPSEREEDPATMLKKVKPPTEPAWVFELRGYTYHSADKLFIDKCLLENLRNSDKFAEAMATLANGKQVKGTEKVAELVPGAADPIQGRISYTFIYLLKQDPNPKPGRFLFINKTYIDSLNTPAGAGGAMPGGAAGGGAPVATGPAGWVPLWGAGPGAAASGGFSGGAGGAAGVPAGGDGGGAGFAGPMGVETGFAPDPSAVGGLPMAPGVPPPGAATKSRIPPKPRTEFVVCFFWKEPSSTAGGAAPK